MAVGRVLKSAFALPWEHRKALAPEIVVPLVAWIAVGLIAELDFFTQSNILSWLWMFLSCLPAAWLAVCVHRFLLRDLSNVHEGIKLGIERRAALYALVGLALWAIFLVAMLLADLSGALEISAEDTEVFDESLTRTLMVMLMLLFSAAISALIAGRLCLVLPAIAVGGDVSAAVNAGRGNTLRLTVIFALLPIALLLLIDLLFRDLAGILGETLVVVLGAMVTIVEVAALSVSYRELMPPAPPPTNPPA